MPPITRREQLELDDLLGDIYRGIETLPDKSQGSYSANSYDIVKTDSRDSRGNKNKSSQPKVIGRVNVRQYELPESSPYVQEHKQELRSRANNNNNNSISNSAVNRDTYDSRPERSDVKYRDNNTTGVADSSYSYNQQQSLASFLNANPVGSATPESKRRVRIVDPPSQERGRSYDDDHDDGDYAENDYYNDTSRLSNSSTAKPTSSVSKQKRHRPTKDRVKYVNTNKFIYHQERNPDDEPLDNLSDLDDQNIIRNTRSSNNNNNNNNDNNDDDDDIDGLTRVEYYHTSWLDRQLGRASKRRSSKELNERQVKEKAMIDELKRSLKNGAITLRQSLKGKKNRSPKSSDIFDDPDTGNTNSHYKTSTLTSKSRGNHHHHHHQGQNLKDSPSRVIGSGLATISRNYQQQTNNQSKTSSTKANNNPWSTAGKSLENTKQANNTTTTTSYTPSSEPYSQFDSVYRSSTKPTSDLYTTSNTYTRRPPAAAASESMQTQLRDSDINQTPDSHSYSSRTLPHKKAEQHQLLQSHYRGGNLRDKTSTLLNSSSKALPAPAAKAPTPIHHHHHHQQQQQQVSNQPFGEMRNHNQSNYNYNANNNGNSDNCGPGRHQDGGAKSPIRQHQQKSTGNTISSMPSATEVVRSALSRGGNQISLNQLNKTINLLPNSPVAPSPMTPTQQLRPASPSLSPSPTPGFRSPSTPTQYSSKTLGHQRASHQCLPGQVTLHVTRTVGRPPQQLQQSQQSQQSQHQNQHPQQDQNQHPYQSQHQPTTQKPQPVYANPHAAFMQHRMEQQMKQPNRNVASIREFNELDSLLRSLSPGATAGPSTSSVQTHITPGYTNKPAQPSFGGYMPSNQPQQQQPSAPGPKPNTDIYARVQKQPQQQHVGPGITAMPSTTNQTFTIDVTNKKFDENCHQNEALSEFEPSVDLVPSMEDYQNIAKLNPVNNHYWYKPNMSRDRAISLLKDKPQGTFIVRDSTSFRGAYGLAVKVSKLPKNILASLRNSNNDPSAEYIRHFLIEPTGSGVRLKGYANEPVFDNLPDLIYQHSLTELALPCKLVIPRADIEDARFNQKQKQFFDEFIASKEQAKHQPYERTSPDGGYRRYPGDVYVHNEHRIIFQ